MNMNKLNIEKVKGMKPVAMLPGTNVEILGYAYNPEVGDYIAYVRRDKKVSAYTVRYSAHNEAYISTTVCGIRQRVYLTDCRKITH